MRILLVYPEYPDTFWSFKHALKFVRKKALMPPLSLLTVAALLPEEFELRLIDMNAQNLSDQDIKWADFVFISAMNIQKQSCLEVIEKCKSLGTKIVAGGPLFSSQYSEFEDIDHFVLDEGEITLPLFLEDLKNGAPQRIYQSDIKPDIKNTPTPKWELVNMKNYVRMPIQFSRGCPFDCEFCDVVKLNGKIPRTKTPLQIINELNSLTKAGWNGPVFIVDDNFIGNKNEAKNLLKSLIKWKKSTCKKITFMTEASLNLADDDELLELMQRVGFDSLFIGLETPSQESLAECGKFQNKNRDLIASIKKIHSYGMEISAGFIVGFDNDDETIFKRQIEFIQQTGIVIAMIGLLQAFPGTRLYERLKKEDRILEKSSGNNTDFSINFLPKIDQQTLINGYKSILSSVYSAKQYYERSLTFLKDYKHCNGNSFSLEFVGALIRSMFYLGIIEKNRLLYWKLFFTSLFKYPKSFSKAMTHAVYYFHFKKIFLETNEQYVHCK